MMALDRPNITEENMDKMIQKANIFNYSPSKAGYKA